MQFFMHGLLACAALLAPVPPAASEPAEERAVRAFAESRWDDAVRALDEAYEQNPDPRFLYAKGQALREAERCSEAVQAYEAFLATSPPEDAAASAQAGIEACETEVEEPAPNPPPPTVVEPEPAAPVPSSPAPRWQRDPWGHGLLWSGVAVAGAGGGLLIAAHLAEDRANAAADERTYSSRLGQAPAMSRVAIPLLVGGSALLLAGVARFAVRRRDQRAGAR